MDPASRRITAAAVSVVLTCDLGLVLAGGHPWQGPTILAITRQHGVHLADPFTIALWAAALVGCWRWATRDTRTG